MNGKKIDNSSIIKNSKQKLSPSFLPLQIKYNRDIFNLQHTSTLDLCHSISLSHSDTPSQEVE